MAAHRVEEPTFSTTSVNAVVKHALVIMPKKIACINVATRSAIGNLPFLCAMQYAQPQMESSKKPNS
jgi:hypothetical protein